MSPSQADVGLGVFQRDSLLKCKQSPVLWELKEHMELKNCNYQGNIFGNSTQGIQGALCPGAAPPAPRSCLNPGQATASQGTDGQRVDTGDCPRVPSRRLRSRGPKGAWRESGGGRSLISNPRPRVSPVGAGIRAFHTIRSFHQSQNFVSKPSGRLEGRTLVLRWDNRSPFHKRISHGNHENATRVP